MVHNSNKRVVFLGYSTNLPLVGEHLGIQTVQVDSDLKENDILFRNLYVSVDPCELPLFILDNQHFSSSIWY